MAPPLTTQCCVVQAFEWRPGRGGLRLRDLPRLHGLRAGIRRAWLQLRRRT